ncbi:MAG TPA: NUDIX domain-containing protein [Afifellaceae bacterium]|nr:NUDIX domain-containing protein [Afifellaceae bacterium]
MTGSYERGRRGGEPPIRGVSAVVLRHDAVLMARRGQPPFQDLWSFPGGHVEPGEGLEQALRRELAEETGIAVGDLVRLGTFAPQGEASEMRIAVFAARWQAGEPVAAGDAAEAAFVPLVRVGVLPHTPGARRWIAAAICRLSGSGLLEACCGDD